MNRRLPLAVLVSFAAGLTAAPATLAAPSAQLAEAGGARFPARSFVLTLPERRDLDMADVSVHENGAPVDGLRIVPGDATGARTSAAVLVIDTSRSMRGAPIRAAMAAARRFAAGRPARQRLGVVFFNGRARLALAPTSDAKTIAAVLAAPPVLATGTRIYDATALALDALRATGATVRSIVLLSDGADAGSRVRPAAVVDAARRSKTRIFGFGLRSRSYDGSTLSLLAQATDGRHEAAGERAIAPLVAALGRRFGREYLVSYRSLAPASTGVEVDLRIAGLPGTAAATYTSPAVRAAAPAKALAKEPSSFIGSDAGLALAVALAALLCGLAVSLVVRPAARELPARVAGFTAAASSPDDDAAGLEASADDTARARRRPASRRWIAFAEDIDVAGLSVTPERIAVWTAAGTVLVAVLALWAGSALALVALSVPFIVRAVVSARAGAARRRFESQLADNLQVVASAMRAGHTFAGAMAVAVDDALEPVKRELQRAVTDERLGVPLEEALGRAARRMRSEELEYVGLVATLQRDTGGSTAEVLDRITRTIRERAELKRVVRVLSAQGRLGGGVVTAIPVALAALFLVIRPGYFDPLIHSSFGAVCITVAVCMLATGWIVIRKIVDIEV